MRTAKKPPYGRPDSKCWVKVTTKLALDQSHGIVEGNVYEVAQVLVDPLRGSVPIKIKSPSTGALVGLFMHEFSYCTEDGECLS